MFLRKRQIDKLDLILRELQRMSANSDALTKAVNDLMASYTSMGSAITAELQSLNAAKPSIGATVNPDDDAAVTTAISNIENIVASMNAATVNAQAAITPAASTTATTAAS